MLLFIFVQELSAQVTIGSSIAPDADAILDIKQTDSTSTGGFLLPRVKLQSSVSAAPLSAHVAGMTVYNIATVNDVTPGYYYNDGSTWQRLVESAGVAMPQIFYMPSIVLPTDPVALSWGSYNAADQEFTIDLYTDVYAKQFGLTDASTSFKSTGASSLPVKASGELEYFIVYYDKDVFAIQSLDADGVLKYKLLNDASAISERTFMNIVFKVK
jgi:hypothetical protein